MLNEFSAQSEAFTHIKESFEVKKIDWASKSKTREFNADLPIHLARLSNFSKPKQPHATVKKKQHQLIAASSSM